MTLRRLTSALMLGAFLWIALAFASTQDSGRTECYQRMTWEKMSRTWHGHGEWVCFDN